MYMYVYTPTSETRVGYVDTKIACTKNAHARDHQGLTARKSHTQGGWT